VKRAEKLRETLKPGESEQGTTQKLGETKSWQTGAKVESSKGNPFLLLLSLSEGGTTQKIQLDKLQAKKLLEELDKCSAFLDSTGPTE
jgi:hypothetical protein